MNINMLRDFDNDPGFYAAACAADPDSTSWTGATVYVSSDGGATYSNAFNVTAEATMGLATTILPDFLGGNIVDEISRVTISLTNGSLSSTTLQGLLTNTNACILGDEIFCFRDANLNDDSTYTLSGLLRGRRGSEYAMPTHAVGDRFVLVDLTKMVRVIQSTADIGIPKKYMAISSGMPMSSGTSRDFVNLGTGLKPYAPVQLGGGRDDGENVTLQWVRRSRISGEWRDNVDVPLGEDTEAYVVEIWDSAYANLKRTISGLSSPTTIYDASDQVTDFGSTQSVIYFRVYQLSATVGRGHSADGQI